MWKNRSQDLFVPVPEGAKTDQFIYELGSTKKQFGHSFTGKRKGEQMNTITFPGMGIKLDISKIAFTILGNNITWYAIFIVSAIVLAICIYKKQDGLYAIAFKDVLDLSLYLIPIAFVGARLYYVIFNFEYFSQNILEIFNIKQGGLAIYGGIIAGVFTCYLFAKKREIAFFDLLDYLVPALALRTGHWQMGKFRKHRSIRNRKHGVLKNGNMGTRHI